jgi:pimeloyl-ACP methyl ester carboxylesterase
MQENSFDFKGHRIFYRQHGSGPDALLLHGFPTSSYDWEKIMPIVGQRHCLLAPDFLGFGKSDKPYPYTYSLFEQADLVEALAAHLRLKDVDLICHDYGDSVGLEIMRRQHEGKLKFKIKTCTLLNGSVYFDLVQLRLIQRLLLWPGVGSLVSRSMNRRIFGKQFAALFSPAHPISESELNQHWELLIYNNGRAVYPALNRYLDERREYAQKYWEPTLEDLQTPLCVIWGMADPVAVGAMALRMQQRIPDAEVHLLDNIGHYPQLEVPDVVAEKILAFLLSH